MAKHNPWHRWHRSTSTSPRDSGTIAILANLRYNNGLDRFTLRGRSKVDAQWQLLCLVHNIETLAHAGYAA